MKPALLPALVLATLLGTVLSFTDIRSDAGAVLGTDALAPASLETRDGRNVTIAVFSPDKNRRNAAARDIAAQLRADAQIASVRVGPEPLSADLLDWIWERRFRLVPPRPDDLTVENLSERLAAARAKLGSAGGMVLGDRLLRDPTGSFAEFMDRIESSSGRLPHHDGVWQSRDDTAALIFVTLADQPFDPGRTVQLSETLRALADAQNVEILLLGPRIIAAHVSTQTTNAASFAAFLAGGLLLVWLVFMLRSLRLIACVFLPLAIGLLSATLTVQVLFGSVHVITLGFGGALTGLALDYPLHLLSHGHERHRATRRLILIGASTTSAGFLALLGSGLEVLMQVGVFVAMGLVVAAVVSRMTISAGHDAVSAPPLERLTWRLPGKAWIEAVVLMAGLAVVATAATTPQKALFEPDDDVRQTISRFAPLLPLPSGRYTLVVQGDSLDELLSREAALQPVLETAIRAGALDRYAMSAQFISSANPDPLADLPGPDLFAQRATDALRRNGMSSEFAFAQAEAYGAALNALPLTTSDIASRDELAALFGRLEQSRDGWRENIHLFGLNNPEAVLRLVQDAQIPGVTARDLSAGIEAGLVELKQRVAQWLGVGAALALAVLVFGLAEDWRRAFTIARTTVAAVSATAAALVLTGGTLGIFQIVALTLVVGIGIDYGLFLARRDGAPAERTHCRSVALCAGSTLIAFTVMALAPIRILQEVGFAVSLGVIIMVVLSLAHSRQPGPVPDSKNIETSRHA